MGGAKKITVKISRNAARYLGPDTPFEEKLKAARGEVDLSLQEILLVQCFFSRDSDPEIKSAAVSSLRKIPQERISEIFSDQSVPPGILKLLAGLREESLYDEEGTARDLASHKKSSDSLYPDRESANNSGDNSLSGDDVQATEASDDAETSDATVEEVNEKEESEEEEAETEEEEFQSAYQQIMEMGVAEKIKMALTGDKECRMLLIRDTNKLVSGSVIKNPRITEAEILTISKCQLNNDEILRDICNNKEWIKSYQLRKSLVENCKTPIQYSLRFLPGLTEKDLGLLAKTKSVSSVITTQARRLLMKKEK